MIKYIHLYGSDQQFYPDYDGEFYHEPWVSLTTEADRVNYNKRQQRRGYLSFEAQSNGYINWLSSDSAITRTIEYKLNDGDWTEITSTTAGAQIPVETGDIVMFRGENQQYGEVIDPQYIYPETGIFDPYNNMNVRTVSFSGTTCHINISGNIMSMIYGDAFRGKTSLSGECNFYGMFRTAGIVDSIDGLTLPATRITEGCYAYLFKGGNFTDPIDLPATEVKEASYRNTYADSEVTSVPAMGAQNTAKYSFSEMFARSKVESVPSDYLSFTTTLTLGCYDSMFRGCRSLATAPVLPATVMAEKCYSQMFESGVSLTMAPELPGTTLAKNCYYSMFGACTGLASAPDLPAPTLEEACYQHMFSGCTSLNHIKCLATDISATNCTLNWVSGVASSGTFVKPAATSWTRGTSGIPNNWTVEDAS